MSVSLAGVGFKLVGLLLRLPRGGPHAGTMLCTLTNLTFDLSQLTSVMDYMPVWKMHGWYAVSDKACCLRGEGGAVGG